MKKFTFSLLFVLTSLFCLSSFTSPVKADDVSDNANGLTVVENLTESEAHTRKPGYDWRENPHYIPSFKHGSLHWKGSYLSKDGTFYQDFFELIIHDKNADVTVYPIYAGDFISELKDYSYDQLYTFDYFVHNGKWGYYTYEDSTGGSSTSLLDVYGMTIPQSIGIIYDTKYVDSKLCYVYQYYIANYYDIAESLIARYDIGMKTSIIPSSYIDNVHYSSTITDKNSTHYCVYENKFSLFKGSINSFNQDFTVNGPLKLESNGLLKNIVTYFNLVNSDKKKLSYDYVSSLDYSYNLKNWLTDKTFTGTVEFDKKYCVNGFCNIFLSEHVWDGLSNGDFLIDGVHYQTRACIGVQGDYKIHDSSICIFNVHYSFDGIDFYDEDPINDIIYPKKSTILNKFFVFLKYFFIILFSCFGLFFIYKLIKLFVNKKSKKKNNGDYNHR